MLLLLIYVVGQGLLGCRVTLAGGDGGDGGEEVVVEEVSVPGLHSPVHKTCSGHANPVSNLFFDVTGSVLFSSAKYERVISVWSVQDKRTATVSSLVVNDEIVKVK